MKKAILYFTLSLIIAGCNNGQTVSDKAAVDSLPQDKLNTGAHDEEFIVNLAEGSMLELSLGRYASGHASDQRLKDYGFLMIEEHERLLQQLHHIAATRKIALPDTVNIHNQQLIQSLASKAGNRFDSSYMAETIAHQKLLAAEFDKTGKATSDPMLKNYSRENVSLIVNHLLQLITIRDSINIRKK